MGKSNLYWRTDYQIRSNSLRVIGSDGKMIGVLGKNEAIEKAKIEGLTLVEISPNANPPVAKIVDFGKFKYAEEKKARAQNRGVKGGDIKEVRFSPFIAEGDFNTRLARIKEFLGEKNKVKIVVVFKGPQMRVKVAGYQVVAKIKEELGESAQMDMEPKFLGKQLLTVFSPLNKGNGKTKNEKIIDK